MDSVFSNDHVDRICDMVKPMRQLDPRRPVRAIAHSWITYGKLGTAQIPHVFMAGRGNWVLDKNRMRLVDIELAIIQTVPGGRLETFLEYLEQYHKKILDKKPARILILADITRSIETIPALWRKTPDAIPVIISKGTQDEWSFPMRVCGRPLLLSRLQLWISDKKIVSSLPEAKDDDPNIWTWQAVRDALSTITAKPPKIDDDDIQNTDTINEDVVLAVSMLPWWAELEVPDVYDDLKPKIRTMGK